VRAVDPLKEADRVGLHQGGLLSAADRRQEAARVDLSKDAPLRVFPLKVDRRKACPYLVESKDDLARDGSLKAID
jgi:hypothetical protein